ncbi:zinc-binding dehydrogenase [Streptomyces sp. NPDC057565]|uniref:zinc-binding dehydrogenase n=1 Tax=Streptomyces sp. NPDC057565 TaxID=3346169 RepID=UPI003675986D
MGIGVIGSGLRVREVRAVPDGWEPGAAAAKGELLVQVETLPLEQAAQAHRRIEPGTTTGKLVLQTPAR